MRILMASQSYYPPPNGQAVFSINLAEGLARRGYEVAVATPSIRRRAYRTSMHGVTVYGISAIPLVPFDARVHVTPWPRREVERDIAEFQPEIVHIHDHYPLSRGVLRACTKRGLPVVGTNNFLPDNMIPYLPAPAVARVRLERILWRMVLGVFEQADIVTAATETAAGILRQAGLKAPLQPISCGVRLDRFYPDPSVDRARVRSRYGLHPEDTTVLYVGRVDRDKGLDVLLRSLACLQRDDLQLAIAGRGNHVRALKALARQLGLEDQVKFTGFVPEEDLPALLNSVDLFAMPSRVELQSLATLEAMASGRPVLAADARALPELVQDGVNGCLFEPDDPEDAANGLARLLAERSSWRRMGAASLAKARAHGIEDTVRQYERLYSSLLEGQVQVAAPVSADHPVRAPAKVLCMPKS